MEPRLRIHQAEFEQICKDIAERNRPTPEFILTHVVPGGGKSSLPVLAAHWLISQGKIAHKLCWMVPNGSLRRQAVDAFGQNRFESDYLAHRMEIMESTNHQNPSKGSIGYVTTYQALAADAAGINRFEFERHRYILFLDEIHHLRGGDTWQKAVMPLVERAALVIGATGTVDRADKCPIYLMPYGADRKVCKQNKDGYLWVNYSIKDATEEKAIIEVVFRNVNASWAHYRGGAIEEGTELGDNTDALFTALNTQYAAQLLKDCTDHYLDHWASHRRAKMLVVCMDTRQAKTMLGILHRYGIEDAEIATYKDDDADEAILRFRKDNHPRVLVTVAKAYEGLDVPRITHIACLTHIRSRPWIEQMLARGWRIDREAGPWEDQQCFAFVPADQMMQDCIQQIHDQQQQAVKDIEERKRNSRLDPDPDHSDNSNRVTPVSSAATESFASDLNGRQMTVEETAYYLDLARTQHVSMSPLALRDLLQEHERRQQSGWKPTDPGRQPESPSMPDRLRALRADLDLRVKTAAQGDGERCAKINGQIKQQFGVREAMEERDLLRAIALIDRLYGTRP